MRMNIYDGGNLLKIGDLLDEIEGEKESFEMRLVLLLMNKVNL